MRPADAQRRRPEEEEEGRTGEVDSMGSKDLRQPSFFLLILFCSRCNKLNILKEF